MTGSRGPAAPSVGPMAWRSAQAHVVRGGRDPREPREGAANGVVRPRGWRADRRWAIGCSAVFLALTVGFGWGADGMTPARTALWCAVALVPLAVLWPPQVLAGTGWLSVRGLLRTRTVRTDALVEVRSIGEVAVSLVLRDAYGRRVELAPGVLVANPALWHLVDAGVRASKERGTLRSGARVAADISARVDAQAGDILGASGLR